MGRAAAAVRRGPALRRRRRRDARCGIGGDDDGAAAPAPARCCTTPPSAPAASSCCRRCGCNTPNHRYRRTSRCSASRPGASVLSRKYAVAPPMQAVSDSGTSNSTVRSRPWRPAGPRSILAIRVTHQDFADDFEPLPPGTQLGSRQVVRVLGRGGMGAVYEGLHRDLKKRVAIKTLHPPVAASRGARPVPSRGRGGVAHRPPERRRRHRRRDGGRLTYLVMEFLEGEELAASSIAGALPIPRRSTHAGLSGASPRRTTKAWSTATSSRTTCSCPTRETAGPSRSCSTSASRS